MGVTLLTASGYSVVFLCYNLHMWLGSCRDLDLSAANLGACTTVILLPTPRPTWYGLSFMINISVTSQGSFVGHSVFWLSDAITLSRFSTHIADLFGRNSSPRSTQSFCKRKENNSLSLSEPSTRRGGASGDDRIPRIELVESVRWATHQ
jgi:hypothetical protein